MNRFTGHLAGDLIGPEVVGVLNCGPREISGERFGVLILGTQDRGATSGEAPILMPVVEAKVGGVVELSAAVCAPLPRA